MHKETVISSSSLSKLKSSRLPFAKRVAQIIENSCSTTDEAIEILIESIISSELSRAEILDSLARCRMGETEVRVLLTTEENYKKTVLDFDELVKPGTLEKVKNTVRNLWNL
jgi:hypothetical protein